MYLLNERLRRFFTPLAIIAIMSGILFLFLEKNLNVISYYTISLVVSYSSIIIFLIYVIYPLVKILFKKYGTFIQRIIVLLVLISSSFTLFFSFIGVMQTLSWIFYLAVFINFSSNIKKNNGEYSILSYPIKKKDLNFGEIVNTSSFNVLMSVVLLSLTVVWSLYYFDLYYILTSIIAIILVISSIIYGKDDKIFDY